MGNGTERNAFSIQCCAVAQPGYYLGEGTNYTVAKHVA